MPSSGGTTRRPLTTPPALKPWRLASRQSSTARRGSWCGSWNIRPLFTAGTSARSEDLLRADLPVHQSGRGGQYTYHGPGQRIAYVMLDLNRRGRDVRCHVHNLEQWAIQALRTFGVAAERREGRVGLWVDMQRHGRSGEAKIGAIGVRVRRWVAFHGLALNVAPDLSHYTGIVPCGIREHGVTSLADLGIAATPGDLDEALRRCWGEVFG